VRHGGTRWGLVGGAIDPGGSPLEAAVAGTLRPDGDEVTANGWFRRADLPGLELNPLAQAPAAT
jgi:hypothetical protein